MFIGFLLAWLLALLLHNYQQDAGQHRTAKLLYAALLVMLMSFYGSSLKFLINLPFHYDDMAARYADPVGSINSNTYWALAILHVVLSAAFTYQLFQMARRQPKALEKTSYVLVLLLLTEAFNFHRGWLREDPLSSQALAFGAGVLCYGLLAGAGLWFYRRPFMPRFYQAPVPVSINEA
ncbi:hypothetical protein [Hymenobacter pini]|uniref:hypothetical protein n=1 Tax=Hymenobacter pini TaxID=2880879 RepID=UPI001CF1266E|nr:hypothetical protein [Hymenobacter pini]MCA8830762.1 hypothetical protein [Hymenobacter pini]